VFENAVANVSCNSDVQGAASACHDVGKVKAFGHALAIFAAVSNTKCLPSQRNVKKQILRSPTPQTQAFAGPQSRSAQDDSLSWLELIAAQDDSN
jgi:hypothetical protein